MSGPATVGETVRRLRIAAGLSLGDFASLIRYDPGYISKIENGLRRPGLAFLKRVDAALVTGGALADRLGGDSRLRRSRRPGPGSIDPPGSAELIQTLELAALTGAASPPPNPLDRSTHGVLAATAMTMSGQLRMLCQQIDATTGGRLVEQPARTLARCAVDCTDERCELLTPATAFADLAGWMAQERGDPAMTSWVDLTARLAERLGAPDVSVHVWIRRAEIALYQGDPIEAGAAARNAHRLASPRLSALPARVMAQAAALAGDHKRCDAAVGRMLTAPGRARIAVGDYRLGSTTISDSLRATIGWCAVDLGRDDDSVDCLEATVASIRPPATRMHGIFAARLAAAYARAGDPARAVAVGRQAAANARLTGSDTSRTLLRTVAEEVKRWRSDPAVQEFRAEIGALA